MEEKKYSVINGGEPDSERGLFSEEFENEAIERIRKFSRLCDEMGFVPVVGFSGGKDSQVVYDLCKRAGIHFEAKFNHCFESPTTLNFIREYYPEVQWRREVKQGFFENIRANHTGLLPTIERAFCCHDYKHNPRYVDNAAILGVRRCESAKRADRAVLNTKNKTSLQKNNKIFPKYFEEHCVKTGAPNEILLNPIVDWSDVEVWEYIRLHHLPINPEYSERNRVGCIICPKANFNSNYKALLTYPKLIDAVIRAREKAIRDGSYDWVITGDNIDYSDNKPYYVCRWLNHSFRPFTEKQEKLCEEVIKKYDDMKNI